MIATRYSWGFNINVWAPVDPNHPSEGLCGNNNNDPNDYYSKWSTPEEFGENWRYNCNIYIIEQSVVETVASFLFRCIRESDTDRHVLHNSRKKNLVCYCA